MNSLMQQFGQLLQMTHALRDQMLDSLTDADLAYQLPGANPTLGALCHEMGEVQHAYTESFKTFKIDFSPRHEAKGDSVEKLKAWFKELDAALTTTLEGLSEEDLQKPVDRGTFQFPAMVQFHTYREALLIFYAKASVYLKALDKAIPPEFQAWIG